MAGTIVNVTPTKVNITGKSSTLENDCLKILDNYVMFAIVDRELLGLNRLYLTRCNRIEEGVNVLSINTGL